MDNTDKQTKLFPVRGYGSDFHTGRTRAGEQLLMGLLCPYIVAYFFTQDGSQIKRERREWLVAAPRMGGDGPYQIYEPGFEATLSEQISQWQEELGFSPELIRVQKFFDPEMYVGIEQVPDHLQDVDESDEDFEELQADLREWEGSGSFVFYWAKDYFMASDGEVEST